MFGKQNNKTDHIKDDDVSASFTRESEELHRHEYEEEVLEFGDLNESNTPKPVLYLIRSLLRATHILFWQPTTNYLWPELSDALKECYRELTPQTLKLYLHILPLCISETYSVLCATAAGQRFLHSHSDAMQSALETISTESSQSCVQKGATALVSIVEALHTPQTQQALNSISTIIQSIQQAISNPQAQECVSAFTHMIWNGIEAVSDDQTTTAIAEVSALLSLALEQTRLDILDQKHAQSLHPGTQSSMEAVNLESSKHHTFPTLFQERLAEQRLALPPRIQTMTSMGEDNTREDWVLMADSEEQTKEPTELLLEHIRKQQRQRGKKPPKKFLKLERYALSFGFLVFIFASIFILWLCLGCLGIYHLLSIANKPSLGHSPTIKVVYMMPNGQLTHSPPAIIEGSNLIDRIASFSSASDSPNATTGDKNKTQAAESVQPMPNHAHSNETEL